jgi:hypothetical protein
VNKSAATMLALAMAATVGTEHKIDPDDRRLSIDPPKSDSDRPTTFEHFNAGYRLRFNAPEGTTKTVKIYNKLARRILRKAQWGTFGGRTGRGVLDAFRKVANIGRETSNAHEARRLRAEEYAYRQLSPSEQAAARAKQ